VPELWGLREWLQTVNKVLACEVDSGLCYCRLSICYSTYRFIVSGYCWDCLYVLGSTADTECAWMRSMGSSESLSSSSEEGMAEVGSLICLSAVGWPIGLEATQI
jgi:hypothetical protein